MNLNRNDNFPDKATGTVFINFHLLRNLRMDPISQCCITLGWKVLPGTNSLAHSTHVLDMKIMVCF